MFIFNHPPSRFIWTNEWCSSWGLFIYIGYLLRVAHAHFKKKTVIMSQL